MTISYDLPESVEASVNKALASLPKKKKKKQVLPEPRFYVFGHAKYVVPTSLLKAFIEEKAHTVQARYSPLSETSSTRAVRMQEGWKDLLSLDAASILRTTPEAVIRRLYDVMHGKSMIVAAEIADGIILAMGYDLDRDTNIPVIPGNYKLAKDLVRIRAEVAGEELTDFRIAQLAKRVHRISRLIARYPHHHEMLRDMAPFNCLRPYE